MNKLPIKGILPDGKKLKELRKKLGKTQKGLIQGSSVELRTYQRAEQGLPILPEILQQIGLLLSADLAQLRLDRTQQPAEQENSVCIASALMAPAAWCQNSKVGRQRSNTDSRSIHPARSPKRLLRQLSTASRSKSRMCLPHDCPPLRGSERLGG